MQITIAFLFIVLENSILKLILMQTMQTLSHQRLLTDTGCVHLCKLKYVYQNDNSRHLYVYSKCRFLKKIIVFSPCSTLDHHGKDPLGGFGL